MIDPTSSKTIGYHLFFEPADILKEHLDGVITHLANTYGGPVFPAHVTLLARIENISDEVVLHSAHELVNQLSACSTQLEIVESEDAYFRAFYYRVTPEPILTYHKRAAALFGMSASTTFKPHLSLFYGTVHQDIKTAMMAELPPLPTLTCVFESLHVYRTPGEVATWEKIGEFPLLK